MERLILVVIFVFSISISNLLAAPAAPIEITVSQPDGTAFSARARGDEHYNWMETSAGHTVIKKMDTWYYARVDDKGGIEASTSPVGSLNEVEVQQLPMHLIPARNPATSQLGNAANNQQIVTTPDGTILFGPITQTPFTSYQSGANGIALSQALPHTQYVLTILVSYSDVAITNSTASFQSLMYGGSNSVKDFFLENSYNGFTVTAPNESQGTANDGIISVTRGVNHPDQGLGNNGSVSRSEARLIVQLADQYIDYGDYDTDGDGTLSVDELAIVIIVAGYEASYGGQSAPTPNVWGHKYQFSSLLTLDGKVLSPYTMFGEKHGGHQATIGIMCHELGHLMLGLPDLYDTDSSQGSEGIGEWGLMGSGSWNTSSGFSGSSPSHLGAWSKIKTKFNTPDEIDSDQNSVTIAQAATNEVAKRIWIDKYRSQEYFLVENRQKAGYDAGLPGSGLLIWHIDETGVDNGDETHKLVDLEEADGHNDLDNETNRGDTGDSFPGSDNNTSFNHSSNPNSRNNAGSNSGITVTSISDSSASMTANFANSTEYADHVRYDENGYVGAAGIGNTTFWMGIEAENDTGYTMFDGVDVYIGDSVGATVSVYYYTSIANGAPSGLIHSQTGIAAGSGWNRLLLNTPQSFPIGSERGVVVKVVNNSYTYPLAFDSSGIPSGRSYYSTNGNSFSPMCTFVCADVNLTALISVLDQPPTFTPASAISREQGSPASGPVSLGTVDDPEVSNDTLPVTQISGGTATGITVSGLTNTNGDVTATLAASCTATSGTLRFEVSDGNQVATGDLQVNVMANTAPTFGYNGKSIDFSGSSTHLTSAGPSDNGSVDLITLNSAGTFTGNISVSQTGVVTISDAQPIGNHSVSLTASDNCNADTNAIFTLAVTAVVADAPTIGTAQAGNAQATVSFTPPAFSGGESINSYTVTSSPDGLTGTGAASPIGVSGLTNGQAYTFSVTATNSAGASSSSAASNSVVPVAPQTITFANPGGQDFGASPTLSASTTSNLSVEFSSTTTDVCTITSEGTLTFVTTGNCSIDADQSGSAAYSSATTVTQSFAVNAVVPDAPPTAVASAGDSQATVTFTAPDFSGGAPISAYTVTSNPGNLSGSAAGSPITVSGLTNGTDYTFTVNAINAAGTGPASAATNSVTPIAEQTVTFSNPGSQNFGTSPHLSATASSSLSVEFSSTSPAVCAITAGGTLTFVTTGNCSVDADQAGDAAYLPAATVSRVFAVNAVVPDAPLIGAASADDAKASVTFSPPVANGGAAISNYTVTSIPGGLTADGSNSPITVAGLTNGQAYVFTVTATNGAGTGPASAASNSVTPVAPQTITFTNPGAQEFGTTPTLTATTTSNLEVAFSSTTPSVCTVTSAGTLTFLSTGNCSIDANQAGDEAWLAAEVVTQSFEVNAVLPEAPVSVFATAGNEEATITFTPADFDGGSIVSLYTVTSSPEGIVANGTSSPITVLGLTNGQTYTFTVSATNAEGAGASSVASNPVTPTGEVIELLFSDGFE